MLDSVSHDVARNGSSSPEPRLTEASRRTLDIQLLKRARTQITELRQLLDTYSTELSYEFASPARKVDEALAQLLLRRELEDQS